MLMPYRTLPDPEVQGEGSIDPLGIANMADRLADWILPGMTARMWRPRFLTAIAATSIIVEPFENQPAADGISPAWLVLEWYYVEAMASLNESEASALRRIPGIDKARRALEDKVPMNAGRYLKTPKVFGFHGVYKRLARHSDIANDSLALGEAGYRLLRIWEAEQSLPGFSDREATGDDGAKARQLIRDAVKVSLLSGKTERTRSWQGYNFFREKLVPAKIGQREGQFLWELFANGGAEPHGEVFTLLKDPALRAGFAEHQSERELAKVIRAKMSPELGRRFDAIEAYEGFCRPLQEAFDRLRYLSTSRRPSLLVSRDLNDDSRTEEIATSLAEKIRQARYALTDSPISSEFDLLANTFDGVRTANDLFHTLWDHHEKVQKAKPPEGKRPWFEQTKDGGLVIRPPYRLEDAGLREEYVHPYRLTAVVSFTNDLFGTK
jgi:hypothetical protein